MNQGGSGDEEDAVILLAGCQTQGQCRMGLAGPGGTERDAVLPALYPFTTRQFQHQRLVQTRDRFQVESVQALGLRKPGLPNAALHVAPVPINAFQFTQA